MSPMRKSLARISALIDSSTTTLTGVTASGAFDNAASKHYVLAVLFIAYVFNVADRGVYGVVLESISGYRSHPPQPCLHRG